MKKPRPSVSRRMRAVRTSGTDLELAVRRIVRELGARYRVNVSSLPGKPDLANKSRRWAIMVHGCMWHGHPCARERQPKVNAGFWRQKIMSNRRRDARSRALLKKEGIAVLTIWQCDLARSGVAKQKISEFLQGQE